MYFIFIFNTLMDIEALKITVGCTQLPDVQIFSIP